MMYHNLAGSLRQKAEHSNMSVQRRSSVTGGRGSGLTNDMRDDELRPLRLLPWWAAALGAAAVAVSIAATTLWLLSIAARSPSLRLEAIKIGLSVGAGTGAAFALMLAFRRQWLSERSQRHVEGVARANVYDATQRRITELYGRAVEQLGHEAAAVRLGGLYSLERLAQEEPAHRQTVVGVVCAYLRMPFRLPAEASSDSLQNAAGPVLERFFNDPEERPAEGNESKEELQVRLAAQRLLARHLAVPASDRKFDRQAQHPESYWQDIRVDLQGALLVDFDFSRCYSWHIDFRRARFSGNAAFQGAHFGGTVSFLGAEFRGGAWFQEAEFVTHAGFHGARFGRDAWFQGARFRASASFREAKFSRLAGFGGAEFGGDASFGGAQFSEDAGFRDAHFSGRSGFRGVQFRNAVVFRSVQFDGDAQFDFAEFGGDARFNQAQWRNVAAFKGAVFRQRAAFQGAQFWGSARFDGAQLRITPKFGHANANCVSRHVWPIGWRIEQRSGGDSTMGQVIHDRKSIGDIVPHQSAGTESPGARPERESIYAKEDPSGAG